MKRRILAVLATFALLITAGCSTSASNEDAIEEERAITVSVDYIKNRHREDPDGDGAGKAYKGSERYP